MNLSQRLRLVSVQLYCYNLLRVIIVKYDVYKIPKIQQAKINNKEYDQWKKFALSHFGFFPIFQPFKEGFILRNLSGNALKLYIYLGLMSGNETGETWVSIETMASYFKKSKRSISGWLKELEEAELVERMQLKMNESSHTFLKPYGNKHIDDPNSVQKGKQGDRSTNDEIW